MTFQGSFMGGGTFSDTPEPQFRLEGLGQVPSISPRAAGELTANLLAIQVTNVTGVPTTAEEIIWRIQMVLPRKVVSTERDPNVGPIVDYTPITREDALDGLAGVYLDRSGNPTPAMAESAPLFALPGWLDGIKTIAAVLSQTGFDRVLAPLFQQLKSLVVGLGQKLLEQLMAVPGIAKFIQGIGKLSDGLAKALPVLGAFVEVAFSFINWLKSKFEVPILPMGFPMDFVEEPIALYCLASGRPRSAFPVDKIEYNPAFAEVFARDIDRSGGVPQRVLDLDRYRESLATSPAILNWIKNGPNAGILRTRSDLSGVFGCRGYSGRQRFNGISLDRSGRGAIVAAAYLFGNTSCVRNLGKWHEPVGRKFDQCAESGYQYASEYFDLGRGAIFGESTSSDPTRRCSTIRYQTNWFARTVLDTKNGNPAVLVHPPIPLQGAPGGISWECSAHRAWLSKKLGDANWYMLGEQQRPDYPPPAPQQDFFEPPPYSFKPTSSWTCASPITIQGSGRFPQLSAIADATVTTTTTPAGVQHQTTTYRKSSVVRLAQPLVPAGALVKKLSAVLPSGKLTAVKAGSASGKPTTVKTGIAALVWYKNPLIWAGIGGGVVVASTGGYLLYRKLRKP